MIDRDSTALLAQSHHGSRLVKQLQQMPTSDEAPWYLNETAFQEELKYGILV